MQINIRGRLYRFIPFIIGVFILLFCFLLIVNACYKYHLETEERRQLLNTVKCKDCRLLVDKKEVKEVKQIEEEKKGYSCEELLQQHKDKEESYKKLITEEMKNELLVLKNKIESFNKDKIINLEEQENTQKITYYPENSKQISYIVEYNKNNEEIKRIIYFNKTEIISTIYKYKNNKIIEEIAYEIDGTFKRFFEYNEEGIEIKKVYFNKYAKHFDFIEYFDGVKNKNKLIKRVGFTDNETKYILVDIK